MKPTAARITELSQGKSETKNLMEGLAIDFATLLTSTLPDFKLPEFPPNITKKMQVLGNALYCQYGFEVFAKLRAHPSDTIRGLSCYVLSYHKLNMHEKLELIKPLAADHHFGVREWAWLALRPEISENLTQALALLEAWTSDPCYKLRRFACEITRPKGVWCMHLKELRQEPWKAIALLEALKNDPEKYVQLSLGNWLNDAGKDHPNWVIELCQLWQSNSASQNTKKICKRGLRNLLA